MKIDFKIVKEDPTEEIRYLINKFLEAKALVACYNQTQSDKISDVLHKVGYQYIDQSGNKGTKITNGIAFYGLTRKNYSNGGVPILGKSLGVVKSPSEEYTNYPIIIQPTLFLENFETYFYENRSEIKA